jgi:hypothetical protein
MRSYKTNGIVIYEEEANNSDTRVVLSIVRAEYVEPYKLRVAFSDGEENVVDFEPILRRFQPLGKFLRVELFKQFRLYNGNVQWNNYEMIFPVEDLYQNTL